jgi:small GTP-binding protein
MSPRRSAICELAIWDTSGSEDWISMNTSIYHGSDAVIFVASFDLKEELDEIVTIWKPRLEEHIALDEVVRVLAVNKSDVMDESEVTQADIDRQAAEIGAGTHTVNVSAKDNIGVTDLFEFVVKELTRNVVKPTGATPVDIARPTGIAAPNQQSGGCC